MFDAPEPADKPRTWKPLAGAGGAAVIVLAVALSTMFFGDQMSQTEEATIQVCEEEYAMVEGPPIYGGQVYVPAQMRDYYAVAETHGEVPEPLDEVADEVLAQWDAAGEQWVNTGVGPVVLVWRHDDDTYSQCNVEFAPSGPRSNSVQVGPLVAPDHR